MHSTQSSTVNRINTTLGASTAHLRFYLWRQQLDERLRKADVWEGSAAGALEKSVAIVWRDMCWGSVKIRGWTACPEGDRALGTGAHVHETTRGDVNRIDLGHIQRTLAQWLGGSDLAVAATHLPFALARLGVACIVGSITAIGAIIGGLRGLLRAPYVLVVENIGHLKHTARP